MTAVKYLIFKHVARRAGKRSASRHFKKKEYRDRPHLLFAQFRGCMVRQDSSPSLIRKLDLGEIVFRVKIILARFVNHPDIMTFFRLRVRKFDVKLALFQRGRIIIIANADNEWLFHGLNLKIA